MIFYCFNNNNFVFHDINDFGGITCWSQNPEERPSFEEIVSILKNDQNFITDKINSDDFHKYIEFIDKAEISFDQNKEIYQFNDIEACVQSRPFNEFHYSLLSCLSTELNDVQTDIKYFDLNNCEKLGKIGEGSFGSVYKIIDKKSGSLYAAKTLLYEVEIA